MNGPPPASRFSAIQTRPDVLNDPHAILNVYGKAIRGYLEVLVARFGGDEEDANDAVQDFSARVLRGAFSTWSSQAGRFRDYLKASVHHAVVDFLRQKRRHLSAASLDVYSGPLVDPRSGEGASLEEVWLGLYREAILAETMRELKAVEETTPNNVFHTLIRLVEKQPGATGEELAKHLTERTGRPYEPANVRQQLHRARQKVAGLLRAVVGRYVADPAQVEDELRMLGLAGAADDA